MRTLPLHINPCDLKTVHVRVAIILDSNLSADAIEAELRERLERIPGFHQHVVTVTHTEAL